MAGSKEIYIGEILEALQSNMSDLSKTMDESAALQIEKLNEVTDVLSNIYANTGVALTQKVFSGADLSAIALEMPSFPGVYGTAPTDVNAITRPNGESYTHWMLDLTNIESIKFTASGTITNESSNYSKTYFAVNSQEYQYVQGAVEIDLSGYTGVCTLHFWKEQRNTLSVVTGYFTGITLVYKDGTENTQMFLNDANKLNFTDNLLKPITNTGLASGILDFSSIFTDVGKWVALITNGICTDTRITILDHNYNILKYNSPAGSIAMNTIPLYTLKVLVQMSSADDYLSGIVFRYF